MIIPFPLITQHLEVTSKTDRVYEIFEIQSSLYVISPENGTSVDKLLFYILWIVSGLSAERGSESGSNVFLQIGI